MFNWFFDILTYFGFYSKNARILFLGLDNAGKTTLLRVMKDNRISIHQPTIHPNNAELIVGNVKFNTFDLGGHEAARKLWRQYSIDIDGIVFLVDAQDSSRFTEAKKELQSLLFDDLLHKTPILILVNKIDCQQAVSEYELRDSLSLQMTSGKNNFNIEDIRPIEVFMCSVVRKLGYQDGFEWLCKFI